MSYDGANYIYSTPYGIYTWLQPGNILKFVNHYGEEVVSKSVYVLQYLSGQTWLPLIDFSGVASPIHNSTFYRLTYSVMDKKKVMGSVVIDFDCSDPSKPPKVSISFTKSALWNLGDFRWIWDVVPASNYRYYINDELTTNVNATYPDITAMSTPQSVGAKSKLYLGKDATLNADGMWLSVGTEDYGATERLVGPEPFWNGKGTVSIFPVNAASIDPDIAYTEMIDTFTSFGSDGVWGDYNVTLNKGVPKGAIVEIAFCMAQTGTENTMGIRTDGSALNRYILIHEAEGGGQVLYTMPVKVHSTTGIIEAYHSDVSDLDNFRILGYFTNCGFTEAFGSNAVATINTWTDLDLGTHGGLVHSVILSTQEQDVGFTGGIRTNGGADLTRSLVIHEPEAGGESGFMFYVKSDANDVIEYYISDTTTKLVYDLGYFDSTVDFVEGWTWINTIYGWEDADLSTYLDQDGRIANFILTTSRGDVECTIGVRTDGSALARTILVHESESADGTEYNGYTVSVLSSVNGVVELYTGDATSDYFMFAGYFKPAITNTAPVNDACDSTATFDYNVLGWINMTVSDADLVANLYTVQITITTSDSKTSVYLWTQSTGVFSETSDPNGISSESGSVRVNIDTDTDKIAFKIKFTQVPALGNCNVQAITTDDATASDTDTYTAEFRLIFSYKAASKSLTLSSSAAKLIEVSKVGAKSLTMADSATRSLDASRATTQSLTLTSIAALLAERGRTAAITIATSLSAAKLIEVTKAAAQTLTFGNVASRLSEFIRAASQTITNSFDAAKLLEYTRAAAQSISGAFSATRLIELSKSVSQALGISGSASKLIEIARSVAQNLGLSANAARLAEMMRGVTQGLSLSSSATKLLEWVRSASAALSFASNAAKLVEWLKAATQALTLGNAASRLAEFTRAASQSVTLASSALAEFIAGVQEYLRDAATSIGLTANAARMAEILKSASQGFTFASSVTRLGEWIRAAAQSVSLGRSASKIFEIVRGVAQTLSISSSASKIFEMVRSVTQSLTIGNTVSKLFEVSRAVSQSLNLGNAASRIGEWLRAASQGISVISSTTRLLEWLRAATQSITIGSSATKLFEIVRSVTQSLTLTNAATKLFEITRTASQILNIGDTATRLAEWMKAATQSININNAATRLSEAVRAAAQAITFSSTATKILEFMKSAAQTLTLTNVASKLFDVTRTVTQGLTIGNAATRLIEALRSATQGLTFTNTVARLFESLRAVTQDLNLSSAAGKMIDIMRQATQSITFGLSALAEKVGIYIRSASLTITTSLSATRLIDVLKNVAQTIILSPTATRLGEWLRITTQGIAFSGSASKLLEWLRAASQSINIINSASKIFDIIRNVSQSITTSLSASRLIEIIKTATQSISTSLSANRIYESIRSAAQNIMTTFSATKIREVLRSVSQAITATFDTGRLLEALRSVSQTLSLTNIANAIYEAATHLFNRSASLALSITSNTVRLREVFAAASLAFTFASSALGHVLTLFNIAANIVIHFRSWGYLGALGAVIEADSGGLLLMGIVAGFLLVLLLVFLLIEK